MPIAGGGRVTGKVGAFDVGALNLQAGDAPNAGALPTNFTVARIKRDLLRRSAFGVLFTNRSVALGGGGASQTFGPTARSRSTRTSTPWPTRPARGRRAGPAATSATRGS